MSLPSASEDALLIEARAADPGFDEQVLAQMMTTLDRFTDDEIPASAEVVPEIRLFFARWAEELSPAWLRQGGPAPRSG
jgi:hypothetical protein